jgi:hypothetical protein
VATMDKPTEAKQPKIMVKPLPEILDEIEDSIRLANEAAAEARAAAQEARRAGDQAAKDAIRAAAEAIARVEDIAKRALRLAELLKLALTEATAAVDKRLTGKSLT